MNFIKGEVPVQLSDGREFVLQYDFEAGIHAESLYRKPVSQIVQETIEGFSGATRALFYGMLKRHHPDITPSEVAEFLDGYSDEIEKAMGAAAEAAAAPKDQEDKASEDKEAGNVRRPRGKNSGSSGAKPA